MLSKAAERSSATPIPLSMSAYTKTGAMSRATRRRPGAFASRRQSTAKTTTYLEDFVYAFTDGGLLGIEPVGSVENVSGTLMLAENDKVLDILLGGAVE